MTGDRVFEFEADVQLLWLLSQQSRKAKAHPQRAAPFGSLTSPAEFFYLCKSAPWMIVEAGQDADACEDIMHSLNFVTSSPLMLC